MHPTCDNDCTRMGWVEAIIAFPAFDMHISHSPGADLDDEFWAFNHDEQEMVRVRGWLVSSYERIP